MQSHLRTLAITIPSAWNTFPQTILLLTPPIQQVSAYMLPLQRGLPCHSVLGHTITPSPPLLPCRLLCFIFLIILSILRHKMSVDSHNDSLMQILLLFPLDRWGDGLQEVTQYVQDHWANKWQCQGLNSSLTSKMQYLAPFLVVSSTPHDNEWMNAWVDKMFAIPNTSKAVFWGKICNCINVLSC